MNAESQHKQDTQFGADAPAVSVIVPAYNVAAYIGDALASVFAQTFTAFEVIVINDGSPDTADLERVLEPYRESIIYIKQENRGPSGARNAGIRRAQGQYVALLDADDTWLPQYLSDQIHALTAAPALDLIYADAMLFGEGDTAGQTFMDICPSMGPVTLESLLSQRCVLITSCVIVRRQTLIDAGLFDENYYRSEDFDLWVRLIYTGARLGYQRKVLARHRLRPDSLAGDKTRMHECAIDVYANLARKLKLTPHERELIDTQIAKYQFELALASGKRELRTGNSEQAAALLRRALDLQRTLGQSRLKLRLALLALRVSPTVVQYAYLKRSKPAFSRPPSQPKRKGPPSLGYTIAHVMPWPGVGGTEHATLRIAQATANSQLRHVMFCLRDAPAVSDFFARAGFDTVDYERIEPSYRHAPSYLLASYRLAREFRRLEIDLVHCADVAAGFTGGLAGRLAQVPVLCHVRSRHVAMSRRDRSFLRAINKFSFVSADAWRHFAYKVSARRGVVVYDGIDVCAEDTSTSEREVREELGIGNGIKVIGMVARVSPQKDYSTLTKAAARVVATHPRVRFLIVGDYAQEEVHRRHYEEVKHMLAINNLTPYFIFTGFRREVARLVSAMDIFVLSTHLEGLPLVLLEAMAQAKPVVATAVGGVPEIVCHNHTGLLYGPQDDAQLAEEIISLLDNQQLAAKLGVEGQLAIRTHWSKEQFAANMMKEYQTMLGGRTPRRAVPASPMRSSSLRVITEEGLERSK